MHKITLRDSTAAITMFAALAFPVLPAMATEANVDVNAGVQDPAAPIHPSSPSGTSVEVDARKKDVDVSVDRDPALRMPQVEKPGVSVEAPGADIKIDRN